MLDNQLGKRNSHPFLMSYMRGLKYLKGKGKQGKKSQNGTFKDSLANELGVSKNTILRDAKFAQAVDTLSEFKNEICTGQTPRTKQEIVKKAGVANGTISVVEKIKNAADYRGTKDKLYRSINEFRRTVIA